MSIKGIDVSKHNGKVDWEKVKADGIQFAIIRIGWGNDSKDQDDTTANRNMDECERIGIPYGVYIYSYALNEADAVSEAEHILRMIKGRNVQMGIWFDMEDADNYKNKHKLPLDVAHKELYTNICEKFCEVIRDAGYSDVGVYASKSVFETILNSPEFASSTKKWVAQWGNECTYKGTYTIWQYTDEGVVNGSSKRTDMNIFYGELPKVNKPVENKPIETKYKVGQCVAFSTCYKSSTDDISKHIPATKMSKNYGTITKIIPNAKNPYLLDNGLCWVNDGDIRGFYQEASYFPKYNGTSVSIVDALKSMGIDSSINYRTKIAEVNKISDYKGQDFKNAQMLKLLKDGKLIKP
mgnify:CR=1 FL=1